VLEQTADLKASPLLQEKLRRHPKIELYTSTEIVELSLGEDGKLAAAVVRDRTTGYTFAFNPAAVFVYAGMSPNTEAFKGTMDLDEAGFIVTDRRSRLRSGGVRRRGRPRRIHEATRIGNRRGSCCGDDGAPAPGTARRPRNPALGLTLRPSGITGGRVWNGSYELM